MAKIIEAKAVISAQDNTGGVFDSIAKKIEKIGKAGKAAQAVERMAKSIDTAQKTLKAIDVFDARRGAFADARKNFRDAQTEVDRLARAMAVTGPKTAEMEKAFARAQRSVSLASKAFEQQKDAVLSSKRALEGMGVRVNQVVAHQTRLRTAVEQSTAALAKHEAAHERSQRRRAALGAAGAAAGAWLGHEAKVGTKAVLHTYQEFDRERRFGKAVMGISDDEQEPLVNQAIHMGATTRYNDIQVLHGQRDLAARGVKRDAILGMMPHAAALGMATDLTLPEAVKLIESGIFMFKKPTDTTASAEASAKQTADVMTLAMKASGMTPDDIAQVYKFGAPSAKMAGVSEQNLLAFGGVLKKAGIGGPESGTAWRALMANLQSPTAGARTAMLANGMDFSKYQRVPDSLAVEPFVRDVSAKYGVKLDDGAKGALGKIFADKATISDPSKFSPAVLDVLSRYLGGDDAKSKKSIAGLARRYRDASMNGVDANAFLKDLFTNLRGNLQFANSMFGAKQGSRIATALNDPETFEKVLHLLNDKADGYSKKIADERNAGFDGAVTRLEGTIKNFESAVGRALDNNGKGGLLTRATDKVGQGIQWAAELPPWLLATGAGAGGALATGGAAYGAWKFFQAMSGGFGLTASAAALDGAAAALTGAAAKLATGGGVSPWGNAAKAPAVPGAPAGPAAKPSIWSKASGAVGGAVVTALPYVGPVAAGVAAYELAEGANEAQGITTKSARERLRKRRDQFTWWGGRVEPRPLETVPEITPTMTYGTGVGGGGLTAQLQGSAEVHGEAELTLKVEAPELIRVYEQAKTAISLMGQVSANGPGSTGKSSPDANAPWGGTGGQ